MKNHFDSANKYYSHFISSEVFHNFQQGFLLTDGIFEVAGEEECFWFLKIMTDAQDHLNYYDSQTWTLKRIAYKKFRIEATDCDGNLIFEQDKEQCNFFFDDLVVCMKDNLVMLPSEYLSATRSQLKITANPYYLRFQLMNTDLSKRIG